MKRTKKRSKTVHAILTSDWHLREDTPICRTDDFVKAQWSKVKQVRKLQEKYNCPVLHAGDLFHHWKPSPALLSKCIEELPEQFYTIYGQHDLPQHNLELAHKTGIYTLATAGRIQILPDGHWGQEPDKGFRIHYNGKKRYAGIWHHLTYIKAPFPGASGGMAAGLLRKYKNFNLLLTGDNHQQFTTSYKNRILVNPGSLTRQKAGENHHPSVFLYDAEKNHAFQYPLKINKNVISREHIDVVQERDERINAFVERLGSDWEAELDFPGNLKRLADANNIDQSIMNIVYKSLE